MIIFLLCEQPILSGEDRKDYKLNYHLEAISSSPGKDSRQSRDCKGRALLGGTLRVWPLDKLVTIL